MHQPAEYSRRIIDCVAGEVSIADSTACMPVCGRFKHVTLTAVRVSIIFRRFKTARNVRRARLRATTVYNTTVLSVLIHVTPTWNIDSLQLLNGSSVKHLSMSVCHELTDAHISALRTIATLSLNMKNWIACTTHKSLPKVSLPWQQCVPLSVRYIYTARLRRL